jgi:hypothetical protein
MKAFLRQIAGHRRLAGTLAVVVVAAGAVAIPVLANLGGSSFDAGDGNLVLDDEAKDWVNAPNFAMSPDKLKGEGDNAFGEGTSEDTEIPSLKVDGIPPNKSDITRFYEANETVSVNGSDKTFLYLAWERIKDPTGTTNFDFELNQLKTLSSNGETPVRKSGDILIKYDLPGSGSTPGLGYHVWTEDADTALAASKACEANSKFPCWDKVHSISGGNFEASVNTGDVTDPILATGQTEPRTLSARTFGEAAINLTDAGILPAGACDQGFASAYLKSRSSDAFNSAIKDFSSPLTANINSCKPLTIKAKKVDSSNSSNLLAGATFELWTDADGDGAIETGDTKIGTCSTTQAANPCTLVSDRSGTGEECFVVKETVAPPGYNLPTNTTQGFCHTYTGTAATVTKTFTDDPAGGTINIQKQDDAGNPLGNVTFKLYTDVNDLNNPNDQGPPDGPTDPNQDSRGSEDTGTTLTCTTAASGTDKGSCSITDIPLGKYWVVEDSGLPAGYEVAPDQYADVGLGTTAGQGQTISRTFIDPRKHKVVVIVCHEGSNTLAKSNVTQNGTDKQSLATGADLPEGVSEAKLCGLGGASYGGITGHPTNLGFDVDVGSGAPH